MKSLNKAQLSRRLQLASQAELQWHQQVYQRYSIADAAAYSPGRLPAAMPVEEPQRARYSSGHVSKSPSAETCPVTLPSQATRSRCWAKARGACRRAALGRCPPWCAPSSTARWPSCSALTPGTSTPTSSGDSQSLDAVCHVLQEGLLNDSFAGLLHSDMSLSFGLSLDCCLMESICAFASIMRQCWMQRCRTPADVSAVVLQVLPGEGGSDAQGGGSAEPREGAIDEPQGQAVRDQDC